MRLRTVRPRVQPECLTPSLTGPVSADRLEHAWQAPLDLPTSVGHDGNSPFDLLLKRLLHNASFKVPYQMDNSLLKLHI